MAEGFGASLIAPGHVTHTANKKIRLGSISKNERKKIENIVSAWRSAGLETEIYEILSSSFGRNCFAM